MSARCSAACGTRREEGLHVTKDVDEAVFGPAAAAATAAAAGAVVVVNPSELRELPTVAEAVGVPGMGVVTIDLVTAAAGAAPTVVATEVVLTAMVAAATIAVAAATGRAGVYILATMEGNRRRLNHAQVSRL